MTENLVNLCPIPPEGLGRQQKKEQPSLGMLQNFVSKTEIDGKKQKRKEYFQDKLKKAQDEYDSVKKKRELEHSRGDSEWILPTLEARIRDDSKSKKRKKKHSKKKHKKMKLKLKDSSSESSDKSDDEWEEASQKGNEATSASIEDKQKSIVDIPNQREDWMMASSMFDVATSSSSFRDQKTKRNQAEKKKIVEEERKKIHSSRELNLYWNDGGNGMPIEHKTETKTKAETTTYQKVGDSGRSWIQRSYDRVKQQAIDEGIPLEELITKRWGSMEKLNALLKTAESRNRQSSSSTNKSTSGWRKQDVSSRNKGDEDLQESKTKEPSQSTEELTISPKLFHTKEPIITQTAFDMSGSSPESPQSDEVVVEPLSEKEKNDLNAKILRAELMGDEERANELKSRLENGSRVVKRKNSKPISDSVKKKQKTETSESDDEDVEHVVLAREDKHGNLYPVKLSTGTEQLSQKQNRKKKKITSTHDADGQRVRYFEDDDNVDLKTMVEQERLTSTADQQSMLARLAGKHLGHAQGDDYTLDDMFVTASATKGTTLQEERRVKEKAAHEHRKREDLSLSCRFCFENPRIAKHLIIAIGIKTYLALPLNASLTEGHCIIIPMNHVYGQTYLDEDVVQEVKIFKKGLTKMFADKGEDTIFLETCKKLNRQPHCIIECVPLPKELGEMAPIYFKKAITETGSEWRQNKRIVDIKAADGVAKAIPKGLPYFSVEFGLDGGFAHVIEDEESFSHYFGKEIIGGMLDLEPRLWRKPPKESFEQHKRKVLKFADSWKPYDWTYRLKEEA